MVKYDIVDSSGNKFVCEDYCFRGIFKNTSHWILSEADYEGASSSSEEEDEIELLWNQVKDDAVQIVWKIDLSENSLEVIENIPWIKSFVEVDSKISTVTVNVSEIPGDHAYHILSALRNIQEGFSDTYFKWRKETETVYDAFFMTMFGQYSTDWEGKEHWYKTQGDSDYMFVNTNSISELGIENLYKNGPTFRLPLGLPSKDFSCKSVKFKPVRVYNEHEDVPPYYMFYSFETDKRLDDKQEPLGSAKRKRILKLLNNQLQGKAFTNK